MRILVVSLFSLGVFAAVSPVLGAEVLLKGTGFAMTAPFVCGGTVRPAGQYDLLALYEPKPQEKSSLQVSKDGKVLCEVPGSSTAANSSLITKRARIFLRVNASMQAIQVDIVLPSGVRSRIFDQVFYLPLPAKN